MRHRNTWATAVLPATQRDVLRPWGWPADSLPLIHKLRCCNYHERSQVPKVWTNIITQFFPKKPWWWWKKHERKAGMSTQIRDKLFKKCTIPQLLYSFLQGLHIPLNSESCLEPKTIHGVCWQRNIKAKVSLSFHNSVFFPCNLLRIQQPEQLLPLMASYSYG